MKKLKLHEVHGTLRIAKAVLTVLTVVSYTIVAGVPIINENNSNSNFRSGSGSTQASQILLERRCEDDMPMNISDELNNIPVQFIKLMDPGIQMSTISSDDQEIGDCQMLPEDPKYCVEAPSCTKNIGAPTKKNVYTSGYAIKKTGKGNLVLVQKCCALNCALLHDCSWRWLKDSNNKAQWPPENQSNEFMLIRNIELIRYLKIYLLRYEACRYRKHEHITACNPLISPQPDSQFSSQTSQASSQISQTNSQSSQTSSQTNSQTSSQNTQASSQSTQTSSPSTQTGSQNSETPNEIAVNQFEGDQSSTSIGDTVSYSDGSTTQLSGSSSSISGINQGTSAVYVEYGSGLAASSASSASSASAISIISGRMIGISIVASQLLTTTTTTTTTTTYTISTSASSTVSLSTKQTTKTKSAKKLED